MSAFVVSNIATDLKMLSNDQRFIFGNNALPEPLGAFKIDNIFTPVSGNPSVNDIETRNNTFSGFRWRHTTNTGDTSGSLKLQSFVNAESTGNDILTFNQDGSVLFNTFVSFSGFNLDGNLDLNGNKAVNSADPTNPTDLVNKRFVEDLISSITAPTITLTGAITGTGSSTINTTLTPINTSQISDFNSSVSAFRLDEFALPTSNINLNNNKIVNLTNPTNPNEASTKDYVDTHTWLVANITDFTSGVTAFRLDQFASPTANINLNNHKITNLANPTAPTDGANRSYVDNKTWTTSQISDFNSAVNGLISSATITSSQISDFAAAVNSIVDSGFGPDVNLPFTQLNYNWTNSGSQAPYYLVHKLNDSYSNKSIVHQVVADDALTSKRRFWQESFSIGDSIPALGDNYATYELNFIPSNESGASTFPILSVSLNSSPSVGSRINLGTTLNFNGWKGINVATPTAGTDAANRQFVLDTVNNYLPVYTLTGAVTGTSSSANIITTFNSNISVSGATQIFNYSNALTSSIFSLVNPNPSAVTRYRAGTSTDYLEMGYDGGNGYSYINLAQFSNDRLAFRVNGTGIAAFLATGLFGFGTITPTLAKVQINGGVQNLTGEESALRVVGGLTNIKIELQNTSANGKNFELRSSSSGFFEIADRNATALRFVISNNGNIGIGGSNSPNAALQFGNVVANRRAVLWETANNDHQFFGLGIGNGELRYQIDLPTAAHVWYTGISNLGSTELMRLKGNGQLLLTRNVSGHSIEVSNDSFPATLNDIVFQNEGTDKVALGHNNALNQSYLMTYNSSNLVIGTNGNVTGTITTAGDTILNNTLWARRPSGSLSMQGNATGTTVSTANTFVKVAGTTTSSNLNQTSMPQSNRITYTGTTSIVALITCSFTATYNTGTTDEIIFAIYKNGAQIPESRISFDLNYVFGSIPTMPFSINTTTTLNTNDYVELWVTMTGATRTVTVSRYMMTVIAI